MPGHEVMFIFCSFALPRILESFSVWHTSADRNSPSESQRTIFFRSLKFQHFNHMKDTTKSSRKCREARALQFLVDGASTEVQLHSNIKYYRLSAISLKDFSYVPCYEVVMFVFSSLALPRIFECFSVWHSYAD